MLILLRQARKKAGNARHRLLLKLKKFLSKFGLDRLLKRSGKVSSSDWPLERVYDDFISHGLATSRQFAAQRVATRKITELRRVAAQLPRVIARDVTWAVQAKVLSRLSILIPTFDR